MHHRKKLSEIIDETPALAERGDWKCINIETNMAWPTAAQPFEFEGQQLWIIPLTLDHHSGLAINRTGGPSEEDSWSLLYRALSYLSWVQDDGATVLYRTGGHLPHMMGINDRPVAIVRASFDLSDIPDLPDGPAKLALALMREARALNHPAFAFLSFFKVLETAIPDGPERGGWAEEKIPQLSGRAKGAVDALTQSGVEDVWRHLRESGRHAIAHARSEPIINPDDPRDASRLSSELPIVEALAEYAIEERLGVQTRHTIWREHLYELRRWKDILGEEAVTAITSGELPSGGEFDLPIVNIRQRRSEPFVPLEGMRPVHAAVIGNSLELTYQSADGLVDFTFKLDFAAERLRFDPEHGLRVYDVGSSGAARSAQAVERFMRDYFGNGELQIWNSEKGKLISRCDAFIPVNVVVNPVAWNDAIERWNDIIAERETRASSANAKE